MINHLKRSELFFISLLKAKPTNRNKLLHAFPPYVVDDIVEILYNIIHKRVPVSPRRHKILSRHKTPILKILNSSKSKRRNLFYKQKGGFIGAILPILSGVLGAVIANA